MTTRTAASSHRDPAGLYSILASLAFLACTHAGSGPGSGEDRVATRAEVLRVDAGWSRTLAARDPGAFASVVAEDALFAGRRGLSQGRQEIRAAWSRWFEPGAPSFAWAPDDGGAAASGELAWSTGTFHIDGSDAQGRPAPVDGRYVSVWRKDPDGRWRALLDGASAPASALGPGLERSAVRTVTSRSADLEAVIGTWRRGGDGPRQGVFITVRQREPGGAWTTAIDSAVPTSP